MTLLDRRRLIAAAALAALATAPLHALATATVGQSAPDFALSDTAGKTLRLSDFKGKTVVLEWTNPGCPFVRKHYDSGNMQTMQREAVDRGVVWLAVNSTETASGDYLSPAKLAAWMQEKRAAPTATLMDEDGKVGRAYGARTTPHMYIVNPQGQLIYAGGIDSIPSASADDIPKATNYVKVGVAEALAGKPLTASTTRPYGCSIKYKS